ncbi:bifunctional phosphopantothenoylcysteine decarboxylase/phosphopantothenate--cysteine ligase CoaBC [Paramagnetospirillum kuznetsovii]|uniref:Coenzyme A biosynthesis bifunctional protein CoaBC n=1 Tax=Paramagnetospirillum kuznetsovii TaxID=2053833 RepID=A0A364NYJ9_9PROT|nr:bifunctional phosphopantothenoylcysteine decarboxylase/phosphopantothenate--cysteine ligase CoaBC [Paramagnetospirillum kuznetsovii]RAU21985.1 bifunctional phosphopantothenoylcysteine decarboxylase/phosphopantothenate--cysteine ligase CoaBC [Paramagnetospirillum kuznetsovii]
MLDGKRVLLIISGGIAAYKSLELIRRLKDRGCAVRCILTKGGANFVTPLSVAALSGDKVYQETFDLTDEAEMGHIRLSREADLVVVAPATANLLAKMANGIADDLASTALLATDKKVLVAPAMNTMMWEHAATQANLATLKTRGVAQVGPNAGDLACGEVGAGRMAEPAEILAAIEAALGTPGPLAGKKAVVTSGPTHEAIDPVRYIANHSSGKQGHAIAAALAALGAEVTLVSGPVHIPDPTGVKVVRVRSASEMLDAVKAALPADMAVCAAAVADWTVANRATEKRKKKAGAPPPVIELAPNPDILAAVSKGEGCSRPRLVVGFAAETETLLDNARDKLARKGCDWIVANDVSEGTGTFGGDSNVVHLVDAKGVEDWPRLGKDEVAARLALRIAAVLGEGK